MLATLRNRKRQTQDSNPRFTAPTEIRRKHRPQMDASDDFVTLSQGAYTPVLAKHSTNCSIEDTSAMGVDLTHRNSRHGNRWNRAGDLLRSLSAFCRSSTACASERLESRRSATIRSFVNKKTKRRKN